MEPSIERAPSLWSKLGPGVVYAAAAVGVSHLVQSTRAGADFGLGLAVVILIACFIKYPSLRFGCDYAAATRRSLIFSYREQGRWAFGIYAITQLFSMVFVIAAIALFTLGLLQAALDFAVGPILGVGILLAAIVGLLMSGHYVLLEKISKIVVAVFTILIVVTVALVAGRLEWSFAALSPPAIRLEMVLYIVALIGFMPTPTDGSVVQSLWTCARADATGRMATQKDARLDFNIGYIVSTVLALGFLVMGAAIMHQAGTPIVASNVGFSKQLMDMFSQSIGAWSFPLIATAAIFVMLSTLITVIDGMTRIAIGIVQPGSDVAGGPERSSRQRNRKYNIVVVLLCAGAVLVLATMLRSFTTFIDITSAIVFVISPLIAFLNHRAMWSNGVPVEAQPGRIMKVWSLCGIIALLALTVMYFYVRLQGF